MEKRWKMLGILLVCMVCLRVFALLFAPDGSGFRALTLDGVIVMEMVLILAVILTGAVLLIRWFKNR